MSKGSKRRRENTALVEANWDSIFGSARTPVPDGQMATDTEGATGKGAAVQVLPTDGASGSSDDLRSHHAA